MEEKIGGLKNNSEDLSLKEIILSSVEMCRYLITKWIIIFVFSSFGAIIGFIKAKYSKPIYTATTTFVLEEGDKANGLGSYAGLASMAGINLGGGGGIFQGDNILILYRSRSMIEKALLTKVNYEGKDQLLVDCYIDFNKLREQWSEKPELRKIQFNTLKSNFSRLQDSVLGTIVQQIDKSYLSVSKPDKKLSIIKTEVKAPNEFFAKTFNEQIVKNVNDFYVQTRTKKSLDNIAILQQKTDSVRAAMNGSIYRAAAASDATPNLNATRQKQRSVPLQTSQFSIEANKTMLGELLKNLELPKISVRKEAPLIQVIDQPVYPLEADKPSKLKGIIAGGIIAGFLVCLALIIRKIFKSILL